jgi:hypothetical protein
MSVWSILSWVFLGLLTAINIFIFVKLQKTMKSMMSQMFPGATSMEDAAAKVGSMMQMFSSMSGGPGMPKNLGNVNQKSLNDALNMLNKLQQRNKR